MSTDYCFYRSLDFQKILKISDECRDFVIEKCDQERDSSGNVKQIFNKISNIESLDPDTLHSIRIHYDGNYIWCCVEKGLKVSSFTRFGCNNDHILDIIAFHTRRKFRWLG
jgi:hypothetical protein